MTLFRATGRVTAHDVRGGPLSRINHECRRSVSDVAVITHISA